MTGTRRGLPLALWFGLGWAALLIPASYLLPVVTVLTSSDGPQPRISLVDEYGPRAVLPAIGVLILVAVVGLVLRAGAARTAFVVAAVGVLASLVATVLFHIVGALTLPATVAALVACAQSGGGRG
jgi:hypothetical protein